MLGVPGSLRMVRIPYAEILDDFLELTSQLVVIYFLNAINHTLPSLSLL
jgi:hypothetical protein